uniref:KIB1-4 beta-propeller domain-containing protein n=1 Tax=Arundo donax TaxID=35708 RepID=A0A0A9CZF4_ARUDO
MPGTWMDCMDSDKISVTSLIVCFTHLIALIVSVEELGTIALCRPGAAAWSVSVHEQCRCLSDMVFFQGRLYAIDVYTGDFLAIDIMDEHDNGKPRPKGVSN